MSVCVSVYLPIIIYSMNKVICLLVSLLVLAGCSSQQVAMQLAGSWSITQAMGKSTASGEKSPSITFEGDKVHGNASVNLFHGSCTLKGHRLTFSRMGMTMMMGSSMDVEAAITQALEKTAQVAVADSRLVYLLDARRDTVMTLVRKP